MEWWRLVGINWVQVMETVVGAVGLYGLTIVASRLLGQRQFSTLSSYDLAFTFALGTIIGRGVLVRTNLAGAAVALVVMFALHAGVGWLHHHVAAIHVFTQNAAVLLVADGQVCPGALARAEMSLVELHQSLRARGHGSLASVGAAILEPNGQVSVIATSAELSEEFLDGVVGADRDR